MKPEARVFEITSPTKKISRNYNYNKFFETWDVNLSPTCWSVIFFHLHSMPRCYLTVCDFSANEHVASQCRWQSTDLDLLKLVKKRKLVWPALFRSLPNIKQNGRLGFLKIGEEPDFPK